MLYSSRVIIVLCVMSFMLSCAPSEKNGADQTSFVKTEDTTLIDSAGHSLRLEGLNLMNKTVGHHFDGIDQSTFDTIRSWDMNVVRFGIFWEGLEPKPGVIDTVYLQKLDTAISQANRAGLYVILDMHQDLYSEKYNGDGAPEWACLDAGRPHRAPGGTWDDAYFTSSAIQTAFDNFWANKKATDSVGLQDHLVKIWKTVAKRYTDNPMILGYDLMNEPFIGSPIQEVLDAYFKVILETDRGQALLADKDEEEIMAFWMSDEGRATLMDLLQDVDLYQKVMDASEPIYRAFEEDKLQPFYDRAYAAIRDVDPNHLLFLEPSVSANIGVKSHLQDHYDDKLVYSPHAYDIVTDTKAKASFDKNRLALILNRHQQKREALHVPLVMGEWGAFYNADSTINAQAEYILQQLAQMQSGQIYWSYDDNLSDRAYFDILTPNTK